MKVLGTTQFITTLAVVGLFLAWLALIVRKYRASGRMAPLQDRAWFKDIFHQGLEIIKRSRWILIVPLAAVVVKFCESLPRIISYLRERSDIADQLGRESILYTFNNFLMDLRQLFFHDFFREMGRLSSVRLIATLSFITATAFLLLITYSLLKPRHEYPDVQARGLGPRTRRWLGVIFGLSVLIVLFMAIWPVIHGRVAAFPPWALIPSTIPFLLILPFAYALFIPSMDAADRGQAVSFATGLSRMELYFKPICWFVLFATVVGIVGNLPSYVRALTNQSDGYSTWSDEVSLERLTDTLRYILLGMISFIPVIIVISRKTFSAAFDACANLWARNAKNAAAFVIISTLLLLVPAALQIIVDYRFPDYRFHHYLGWESQTIQFILSLYKVSAGTLIMCSMVVFCRGAVEVEEAVPPEEGEN